MVGQDARQQAFELVKEFTEAYALSGRPGLDFYKLLWVAHWGVENFGAKRVRDMLQQLMENPPDESEDLAERLRDKLFKFPEDKIAAWFYRAMKV